MRYKKITRPTLDPLYLQVMLRLVNDPRSKAKFSRESGLSTTTLRNWERGITRFPQAMSLQMAARAMGMKIVLTDND